MMRIGWGFGPRSLATALVLALPAIVATSPSLAAGTIGVAAATQNHVDGIMGAQTTPLKVGSPVYQNEHVRTAPASSAQLLFQDQTSLSVGPSSEVTLDTFVYDPATNSGSAVLTATRGALRFVSGTQQPHNYQIRTPVATIGVRGTVVDAVVTDRSTSIILGECCADIQLQSCGPRNEPPNQNGNGDCLYHLDVVGDGFTIFEDGRVDGPFTFDGSEHDGVRSQTFPLHTSQFAVESHDPETGSPLGAGAGDVTDRTDQTTIQNDTCQGTDCGCPDCGPGF
jgi:hypothetical protein